MQKKCNCGHKHCCHAETEKKIIKAVDDWGAAIMQGGRQRCFERETCADCGRWISDAPLD